MPDNETVDQALDALGASVSGLSVDLGVFINDQKTLVQNANNALTSANEALAVLQKQDGADQAAIQQLNQALTDLKNNSNDAATVSRLEGFKSAVDSLDAGLKPKPVEPATPVTPDNSGGGTPATGGDTGTAGTTTGDTGTTGPATPAETPVDPNANQANTDSATDTHTDN